MKISAAILSLGLLGTLVPSLAAAEEKAAVPAPAPVTEAVPAAPPSVPTEAPALAPTAEEKPAAPAAPRKIEVQNLGMEAGKLVPSGWHGKFGACVVSRDTTVFHSGQASLCVDRTTQSDNRNACAHQMVPISGGVKLKLKGWVKSEGAVKASYAAQFFDERFTTNDCYPVKTLDGTQDWQEVQAEVTVPENATRLAIALYVEGQGRAWLDDVQIEAEGTEVVVKEIAEAPAAPAAPAEAKLIPVTATPGYFPNQPKAWKLFHESQVRQAWSTGADVIVLGDSLAQGWTNAGRDSWKKNFEPLKSVCLGLAGDTTGNVLWRLENGLLDNSAPKVIVLNVGVNNLWSGKNSSEEIVDGYRAIVEKLRAKAPAAHILVVGVLPVGPGLTDLVRQRATELNVLTAQLNEWNNVKFANVSAKFVRRDGTLLEGLYQSDNLNLTAKGYETLAKELTPVVMELLKSAATPAPAAQADLGPVGR